ncbi:MAG: RNA-binding protein [Chloroflexota bacterium]
MPETLSGELVQYLAKALVDHPDDVQVSETIQDNRVTIHLRVHEDDYGQVIGRDGRIATSLRALAKVAAVREDIRVKLEIGH